MEVTAKKNPYIFITLTEGTLEHWLPPDRPHLMFVKSVVTRVRRHESAEAL